MARKKVATVSPAKPPVDVYPKVFDHFGDPSWALRNVSHHSEPSVFNGIVAVERYQIRVEKIDEPDDVILARLKRLWRTTEKNHHHRDSVRSYVMRKFGWDYGKAVAEFSSEEQGADYCPRNPQ